MVEEYSKQEQFSPDVNTRLRDIEEKQSILKERLLLIGKSVVDQREKGFAEIQELKKDTLLIKDELSRLKELMKGITEQLSSLARKEELMILQRQFDLFRKE